MKRVIVITRVRAKKMWIATVLLMLLTSIICMANLYPVRADNVAILSSSSFTDSRGEYVIVGEVQNIGSSTVNVVRVTATYYDSSNKEVDILSSLIPLSYLLPNAKSPFFDIEGEPTLVPKISTYKLSVSSESSGSIPQGLVITSNSSHTDLVGAIHIVGEIQNTGSATSSSIAVVATCYDSSGKVVDAGLYVIPQDTASGNSAPFDIIITDTSQIPLIVSYSLTAQSSDYALVSASPSSSPTATPSSTSSTPTPTPTIPEFPSLAILTIFIAVAAILAVAVAIRKQSTDH